MTTIAGEKRAVSNELPASSEKRARVDDDDELVADAIDQRVAVHHSSPPEDARVDDGDGDDDDEEEDEDENEEEEVVASGGSGGASGDDYICFNVEFEQALIPFKTRRTTRMHAVRRALAKEVKIDENALRFLRDEARIDDNDTPASLELADGETIDASTYQTGG